MRDIYEQYSIYVWIVLHHRWIVITCAFIVCISGWIGTTFIPDVYKVETKIFLDSGTVLKPIMKGLAVDNFMMQETAMIMRKTLLTRPNLMEVIYDVDLDLQAKDDKELEIILIGLQKNIRIDMVRIEGARKGSGRIFNLSYKSERPGEAKRVIESLLDIFLERILGASRRDSDYAEDFLNKQILKYEKSLVTAEEKLKLFKQKYAGLMPGDNLDYYQRLSQSKIKLEDAQLLSREITNRSAELNKQIQTLKSRNIDESQDLTVKDLSPLGKRIVNMEVRLDELLLQYTEEHPDVLATRRILGELNKVREKKLAKSNESSGDSKALYTNSILFQQLNIMYGQSEADLAAAQAKVETFRAKVEVMESTVGTIPQIETELIRLNRDYGILKDTYEELIRRRTSAELSRDADQSSSNFQFNIIEPPIIPSHPESPNRAFLVTFVFIFGVVFAAVTGLIYEKFKPTFYTVEQIESEYDLPVLGAVSMFWSNIEIKNRKFSIISVSTLFVMLVISYIIILLIYLQAISLPVNLPFLN